MATASYQGVRGSYGECAARQLGHEPVPCVTFTDAIRTVEDGQADVALLPIENSTGGSVGEANDLLFVTDLVVVGETYHHVRHCLIGTGDEERVRAVYSHPQALVQCSRFIGDRERVPVFDTAGAVGVVRDINRDDVAAIASREASDIYGVPVITEDINDVFENYTHFLILGRAAVPRTAGESKTTITFTLRHEPGALHAALRALRGLNLTRIESRPRKTGSFEYGFNADFAGHGDDEEVRAALAGLEKYAVSLRVLGSYGRRPPPAAA